MVVQIAKSVPHFSHSSLLHNINIVCSTGIAEPVPHNII
ncbi:hypothetical protein DCCM_4556 [Desulfocucumis palustris]|uniref:Uncharacterized protein n=1 Tax=Desulfocucumis palustris TaxID=1898651 RepID=A0A2L2XGE2_9FIRM|nr:hypothetical protein DCCM_4556 [Desulfocucumis palustris]